MSFRAASPCDSARERGELGEERPPSGGLSFYCLPFFAYFAFFAGRRGLLVVATSLLRRVEVRVPKDHHVDQGGNSGTPAF